MALLATMGRKRKWLRGATGLALLLLLALPATGWLVQPQLRLAATLPGSTDFLNSVSSPGKAAAHAPRRANDFGLRFADTLAAAPFGIDTSTERVRRLRALESEFGDRPALHGAILRFATQGEVIIGRWDEQNRLTGNTDEAESKSGRVPAGRNTPDTLAAFDANAQAGERLDPDNAFFPFLRAVGFFAAGRDADALAAIERASTKPAWNDYVTDELNALWRRNEILRGEEPGAVARIAQAASVMLPHFAQMRSAARLTTLRAMEAEQIGQVEKGLAIRRALARCGGKMRTDSSTLIGNLIGVFITNTAGMRPGGALPLSKNLPGNERGRLVRARYVVYLNRIGHPDEARWFTNETENGEQVKRLLKANVDRSAFGGKPARWLTVWWMAGAAVLRSALWLFLLAGAAALLGRSRRVRKNTPLPPAVRWGAAAGAAGVGAVAAAANGWSETKIGLLFGAFVLLAGLARAARGARGGRRRALAAGLGAAAVSAAVLLAAGVLVGQQAQTSVAVAEVLDSLLDFPGESSDPLAELRLVMASVSLLPSLLLCACLVFASQIVRVPVSVGLVRGLRGLALPAACLVILVLYVPLALVTVRQEAAVTAGLHDVATHEGRYLARLAGLPWPGPVADTR